MPESLSSTLRRLEHLRTRHGAEEAGEKIRLVRTLARRRLGSARQVLRFHDALIFLRAFSENAEVARVCDEALAGFPRRGDLRRFRAELMDSGIAGTRASYAFSYPMARWLAGRDPAGARIVWPEWERRRDLEEVLPLIASYAESPGVYDETSDAREWLESARSPGREDHATLVERFASAPLPRAARERLYNALDVPVRWTVDEGVGSRTLARWPVRRLVHQEAPLDTSRPDLRRAVRDAPRFRRLDRREGARLVELSRAAMSVRQRELEAFDYADARDAWLADGGRGLVISVTGMRPENRLLPEAVYAGLFLRNGVPAGYWLASALFGSSEVAYNVFPNFRQGESGWMYGRLLALLHHFLGATDFTVFRYQFGHENPEAIASGAFWFYQKLGFRPHGREVLRLMREEERKVRTRKGYRSPPAILRRLSEENIFFHLGKKREDLIGLFPYGNLGHRVTRFLASEGPETARTLRRTVREAGARLGVRRRSAWPADERRAFEAWAPVVVLLEGVERWSAARRRGLVKILRAKGGRSEADFVRLSDAHAPFRRALQRLCLEGA